MRRALLGMAGALALSGLAACGGTPIDTPNPTEMKKGEPGAFSGPDGVFTVPIPGPAEEG